MPHLFKKRFVVVISWQYDWLLIILVFIWGGGLGVARENPDLYQVSVVVTGQGEEERPAAFRSALNEVLTRLNGRKDKTLKIRAEDLVTRYHYATENGSPSLVVEFDPAAIQRLLGKGDVPVKGDTPAKRNIPVLGHRPSTLVWLVVREDDGTIRLAGSDGPSPHQAPIQEAAKRRGVPLVWPMMDLLENSHLPFPEDKRRLVTSLRAASRNYPAKAVWIGMLTSETQQSATAPMVTGEDTTWTVQWTLLRGNAEEQWRTSGSRPNVALTAGVDQLAERLATGVSTTENGSLAQRSVVHIVVTGITSLEAFTHLQRYLENLPEVARIWPTRLDSEGRLSFSVESRDEVTDLSTVLNQNGILLKEASPIDLSTLEDSTLYYRFLVR